MLTRHPDVQRALAILAGAPGIHLAVSVDHVNAGKERMLTYADVC
jgi:hypothetical protein